MEEKQAYFKLSTHCDADSPSYSRAVLPSSCAIRQETCSQHLVSEVVVVCPDEGVDPLGILASRLAIPIGWVSPGGSPA